MRRKILGLMWGYQLAQANMVSNVEGINSWRTAWRSELSKYKDWESEQVDWVNIRIEKVDKLTRVIWESGLRKWISKVPSPKVKFSTICKTGSQILCWDTARENSATNVETINSAGKSGLKYWGRSNASMCTMYKLCNHNFVSRLFQCMCVSYSYQHTFVSRFCHYRQLRSRKK